MKITILGIGNMGTALGRIWLDKNHEVCFSHSREADKLGQLSKELPKARITENLKEAIAFGDVIMLATPYTGLKEIFELADAFDGKIVITCVSNLVPDFTGSTIGIATTRKISVAEEIAEKLPKARVVESFNISFAENLKLPSHVFEGQQGTIFYCGNDTEAKKVVASLIEDADYQAKNAGPVITSRSLETLATAWVQFAVASGLYPRIAFRALLT
jgi:8-hydroxy-5-deazaflavin:NADPH oxidoreductase